MAASIAPVGEQTAVEAVPIALAAVLQLAETAAPAVRARETHLAAPLAQTIAWMWLGFLLVGAVAWLAYRYWRKRHPPQGAHSGTELQPVPGTTTREESRRRQA